MLSQHENTSGTKYEMENDAPGFGGSNTAVYKFSSPAHFNPKSIKRGVDAASDTTVHVFAEGSSSN